MFGKFDSCLCFWFFVLGGNSGSLGGKSITSNLPHIYYSRFLCQIYATSGRPSNWVLASLLECFIATGVFGSILGQGGFGSSGVNLYPPIFLQMYHSLYLLNKYILLVNVWEVPHERRAGYEPFGLLLSNSWENKKPQYIRYVGAHRY